MTNVLAWGDYCCYTGFANVMSNIFNRLKYINLDVVGVNYDGRPDYDHGRFPGRVWPAQTATPPYSNDIYGRQRVIDLLRDNDYDILFILQDTFIVEKVMPYIHEVRQEFKKDFKIVYYYPMDSEPLKDWITRSVSLSDVPVAYSQYGYRCAVSADPQLEDSVRIIPHGVEVNSFFPILNFNREGFADRFAFSKGAANKMLLMNINRNTDRKDIPRSLMVLSELLERGHKAHLYLHMSNMDIGGDFTVVGSRLGLELGEDYSFPEDLDPVHGYPIHELNYIYNCADAVITTSLGEGWGFSLTEAMAVGAPVVGPDHSAISEILRDGRGVLVKAGSNNSLWRTINSDNMILRPLVDVDDMVSKIAGMWSLVEFNQRRERALEFVKQLDWDIIVKDAWQPIFSGSV